ncbi:imm11 family protein [Leptospira santarosai]|uniref:imm11 family protein n=1 Tax=Leptospira santarosai TaxID=28183 RepID=UPI000A70FC41|nr:DUF1629 domain-containing protein [Leptospira santarosai]MDI7228575.1 hypothetical protein [Leptospira santarosai]
MQYFIIRLYSHEPTIHSLPRPQISGLDEVRFDDGHKIKVRLPVVEFVRHKKNRGKILDCVPTDLPAMVISTRFKQALVDAGVGNIDYFPVTISDEIKEKKYEGYFIANIVGRVSCLARKQSVYTRMPGIPNGILSIDKIHLDRKKIPNLKIFRLDEVQYIIVIDEEVKRYLETAKITGVEILPVDGYSD